MPGFKVPQVDEANMASKLPRPLQWPAGAIMGGLRSVMGGDDPAGNIMPGPQMAAGAAEGSALSGLKGAFRGFMGKEAAPAAEQAVTSKYLGGMGDMDLYNLEGGASHGSTVSGSTLKEMGVQPGRMPHGTYSNTVRQPKAGGVLSNVLEEAASNSSRGMPNTPGSSDLLKHYTRLLTER